MSLDITTAKPRIIAKIPLAAATVISIKALIINYLSHQDRVRDLFADSIEADEAARLALTGIVAGYVSYQTDTTTFYLFTGTVPATAGHWQALGEEYNVRALNSFLENISWNIVEPSSIGNDSAGATMYYMNKFCQRADDAVPLAARLTTYGVPIAVNTERSLTGHADDIYVYSLSGTNIYFDVVFDTGN